MNKKTSQPQNKPATSYQGQIEKRSQLNCLQTPSTKSPMRKPGGNKK